jgi:hypothetical protein
MEFLAKNVSQKFLLSSLRRCLFLHPEFTIVNSGHPHSAFRYHDPVMCI